MLRHHGRVTIKLFTFLETEFGQLSQLIMSENQFLTTNGWAMIEATPSSKFPVHVVQDEIVLQPIPIDTHPASTAMFHFGLPNQPLMFLQAMAVAPTCSVFV